MRSPLWLIAGREVSTRIRSKSFLISTAVTIAIFGVLGAAPSLLGSLAPTETVAVVGDDLASALSSVAADDVDIEVVSSAAEANSAVADGAAVIGVTDESPAPTLYASREARTTLLASVRSAVQEFAQARALHGLGVSPEALRAALGDAQPSVVEVGDASIDQMGVIVAFAISIIMFMQLLSYGVTVAQGVVEEKQSRVVEILLSTVSARVLMIGKVLGIGAVGLIQMAIYLSIGAIAASSAGLITPDASFAGTLALCLTWFVPGFLFYAFGYAAAGSLVSRVEEVGQSTTVLTMLIVASYVAVVIGMQDITAPWVAVLGVIPPFSAIVMPMLITAGIATPLSTVGSLALLIVAATAMALLSSRIYRSSVLKSGGRIKWLEALLARN